MYKKTRFLSVYLKSLYENVINIINIAIINFKKNNVTLLIFKNKNNIDTPPIKLPKIILYNFAFLLNINDTDKSNKKSKNIFINKITSIYTFILSPFT